MDLSTSPPPARCSRHCLLSSPPVHVVVVEQAHEACALCPPQIEGLLATLCQDTEIAEMTLQVSPSTPKLLHTRRPPYS